MSSNPWNDFQHEHAGEGNSQAEMSDMYHAEQDGGESSAELMSAGDMADTDENATDRDSGLMSEANPDLDIEPENSNSHDDAESEAYNQDEESTNSGNRWNDFQHEHAGEGNSQAEMSDMYHAEQKSHESEPDTSEVTVHQDDEESISSSDTPLENTETDSSINGNPDNDIRELSKDESSNSNDNVSTEGNQWNDFQHQHKGEGKTSSELSDLYHHQQQEQQQPQEQQEQEQQQPQEQQEQEQQQPQEQQEQEQQQEQQQPQEQQQEQQKQTVNSAQEGALQSASNEWNKFQHEHKDQDLSQQQMSSMYQQQQQAQQQQEQQKQTVNSAQEDVLQSASNEWNKFQHEHKDQDLSQQQMSSMYQQQQQAQQQQEQQKQTVNSAQEDVFQSASNEWNKFQHEHKDQDLSQQQMSSMYHQQQQEKQSQQQERIVNSAQEDVLQSGSNEWNKFQHEHKDQDLSQQQMSSMYQQQQQAQQQQEQQKQTVNSAQEDVFQSASNEWNKFQHEHKDQDLSQQQMSSMYHQQQQEKQSQQQERIVNNLQQDVAQSAPNESNKSEHVQRNLEYSLKEMTSSHNQQNQQKQKPKASVQWNLFQHLYGGKGLTRQEMSSKYNGFKENERTFHWNNDFQLVLTSDGKLQNPDSPAGHEAIKTGLFDEQNCLRRRGDLPFSVFQAKMFAMGNTDRSKISSMYLNKTGSTALHTVNLRQDSYKQHAAVGTTRRDPDHILELQVVAPELYKEHLDEKNFHTLRCVLNGEHNIESRGVKVNRFIKRAANGGIARNYIKLTNFTFKQELVQANQASKLADLCHEQGSLGAETVLRHLADKCNSLHSIHEQVMQLNEKTIDSNEKCEGERRLIESIRNYESEYGPLNFHNSSMTEYRKKIMDEAHRV